MPDAFGLDIVGWSESCDETGGDYYDFITHPDGRIGFAVGDISGHGIGAALLMATARASLRALVTAGPPVDELFCRLNTLLEGDLSDEQFMTFFYGVLDPKTWQLQYCSAGHESPIFYSVIRDRFTDLPSLGVPLGMLPGYRYSAGGPVQFEVGDILVLMTDGVTEAMNPANVEFGRQRLLDIVRQCSHLSANQLVGAIHRAVLEFADGRPMRDDLTMVVVRFETLETPELAALDDIEMTRNWASATRAD
jgi:sigma-B regulation protein RsbU (phosphoserine phosphatase)